MTREAVVDAALELADDQGLEALTMHSLAQRLDCGVMTIYGYVENKEDLFRAISQRGLRDLRLPAPVPTDVEGILVHWGRALRLLLIDHPCLPVIFLTQAVVGPGIFSGVERLLARLGRAGLPPPLAIRAIYAVVIYATGFVAWELPRTRLQEESAYAAEWRREFANLPPEDFPLTAVVLDELSRVAGEEQFEIGLRALAGGLAANQVKQRPRNRTAHRDVP